MTRALVLRALDDALRTAEILSTQSITAVISPVLEIVATDVKILPGAYDAVLASSAKAVELVTEHASFMTLPLHAVGAKTAKVARAHGWSVEILAGNAEAILPLLRDHYQAPSHFLYLAGRDRQAALEAGLRAAGHRVTAVDVYEARAAQSLTKEARAAIDGGEIDVALHYSRRSAEIFLDLAISAGLGDALRRIMHHALSDDVAAPLLRHDLDVSVAAKPDERHLLALLQRP